MAVSINLNFWHAARQAIIDALPARFAGKRDMSMENVVLQNREAF